MVSRATRTRTTRWPALSPRFSGSTCDHWCPEQRWVPKGFWAEYHFRFGTDKIPDEKQVYPFLWEELLRAGHPFLVAAGIYEESVDEIILAARKRLRAA
jgi:hypothetical protein